MDSLLEKLRAAGPQNRDQRDRRRRARLKDKHQMRIASGENMPDLADLTKGADGDGADSPGILSPVTALPVVPEKEGQSEGEDVADRAAQLLQGLRGDTGGEGAGAGSIRVRRRREGNEDERRSRRRRRAAEGSAEPSPTVEESQEAESGAATEDKANEESVQNPGTPVTTVSPPTPERGTEGRPVSISD